MDSVNPVQIVPIAVVVALLIFITIIVWRQHRQETQWKRDFENSNLFLDDDWDEEDADWEKGNPILDEGDDWEEEE